MKVTIETDSKTNEHTGVQEWNIDHTPTGLRVTIDGLEVHAPSDNAAIKSITTNGFGTIDQLNETDSTLTATMESEFTVKNIPHIDNRSYMTVPRDIYHVFGKEAYAYIVTAAYVHMPQDHFSNTILKIVSEVAPPEQQAKLDIESAYNHANPDNANPTTIHPNDFIPIDQLSEQNIWLPAVLYDVADKSVASDLIAGAANKMVSNPNKEYDTILADVCNKWLSDNQLEHLPYDIKIPDRMRA